MTRQTHIAQLNEHGMALLPPFFSNLATAETS